MGGFYSYFYGSGDDESENADYDPHVNRELHKPTNNLETLIHLLKCSLGTGILAMPQAFLNAGLVTGIICSAIVSIIITHCLHILVQSQYKACRHSRKSYVSYPEAFKTAVRTGPPSCNRCGKCGAGLVDIFLVVYQLGICCCYIVFIASNLKKMVDPHKDITIEGWMGIVFIPLVIMNLIPSLKALAPFSLAANLFTLIGLIIIVYYLASGEKVNEDVNHWGNATTFPLFFGTILFALTSPGVVVAIENNMKTPKRFGGWFGMLNIAMVIITLLYIAIGAFGYMYCKSKCSDSITLDLPDEPGSVVVMVLMVLAIFISYALHCYVPVEVVWTGYLLPWLRESQWTKHLNFWNYLLRIVLCIITFIVALAVPRLGLFISLFGAFCLSALGIIFPAMMEVLFAYPKRKKKRCLVVKDIILIIFGLIGLVAGTYASVLAIVLSFSPPNEVTPKPPPVIPPPD